MLGKTVSHYQIMEKLGGGGMGIVYRARDTKLDRLVALKFLPPYAAEDDREKQRLMREAKAASSLDHANICNVHEIGETDDGQLFIVMAHYDGETLKKKIHRGPMKLLHALDVAIQIGEGLSRAHESGITHRDIKPANVIVTNRGEAKVVDFGLAKLTGQTRITATGQTVGTVAYMSPEQGRGEPVDHRTDIWSLGVLVHEMVMAKLPFKGEQEVALLYSIMNEPEEPVSNVRDDVRFELQNIISKALEKNSGERYQHVDDMVVDLKALRKKLEGGGIRRHTSAGGSKRYGYLYLAVAITVLIAATLAVFRFLPDRSDGVDRKSIVVLPFENMSGDKEDEYFSDGITEDIITQLSKVRDLRVISRTSSMRYKGSSKLLREIGEELGAATILEGSVRRYGDEVRITAQLIDARTDEHIWAENYDRKLASIFAIQSDVAQKITAALQATLSPAEKLRMESTPTENLEAYNDYLKGRHYLNQRDLEGYEKSIQYFQAAIDRDPGYALAYAGLADTYLLLQLWHFRPPHETMPKAQSAALSALEIDGELAEVHTSLAAIRHWYLWDWVGAEEAYRRAIELNPNYATAHHWYAFYLRDMRRFEEAAEEILIAQNLDPLSLIIEANVGLIAYAHRGQLDKAIEVLRRLIDTAPDFLPAHERLAYVYDLAGRAEEAATEWIRTYEIAGTVSAPEAAELLQVAETSGPKVLHGRYLDHLLQRSDTKYVAPFDIAYQYARTGHADKAMEWLNKAYNDRSSEMTSLNVHPLGDLQTDSRFQELLRKIGLIEE
jgi:serine/threonine-protein kinase